MTNDLGATPPSNHPVKEAKKSGMLSKIVLADSIKSNFNRSKRYLLIYGSNLKKMSYWMVRSYQAKPTEAKNLEEVRNTVTRAAGGMVASFAVTIFFALVAVWQLSNGHGVASAIVAIVTATYGFRFFVCMVVWAKAKQTLVSQGAW